MYSLRITNCNFDFHIDSTLTRLHHVFVCKTALCQFLIIKLLLLYYIVVLYCVSVMCGESVVRCSCSSAPIHCYNCSSTVPSCSNSNFLSDGTPSLAKCVCCKVNLPIFHTDTKGSDTLADINSAAANDGRQCPLVCRRL